MIDATPKPRPSPPAAEERTPWLLLAVALGALLAIFAWVYARFAGALYFGMDDFIETEYALAKPLGAVIADVIDGRMYLNTRRAFDWPPIPGHLGRPWFVPLVGAYYKCQDLIH